MEYALTGGDDYCLLASIRRGVTVPECGRRIGMVVKRRDRSDPVGWRTTSEQMATDGITANESVRSSGSLSGLVVVYRARLRGTTGTLGVLPLLVLIWDASVVGLGDWIGDSLRALSIWCIPEAGRRLGEPDHGQIVIDEWAGMWLAAFGLNTLTDLSVWMGLLIGFIGFRIFDIAKPLAVSWCERKISGAWGVLMDDIAAGGYVLILALVFGMLTSTQDKNMTIKHIDNCQLPTQWGTFCMHGFEELHSGRIISPLLWVTLGVSNLFSCVCIRSV